MIDTNELRRDASAAHVGHIPMELSGGELIELLDRLEVAEKERDNANAAAAGIALQAETLQAERDALRTELADLRSSMTFRTSLIGRIEAERDALRAKVEAMEKQEAVAFGLYSGWALKATYLKEQEACEQRDRRQLTADLSGSLEAYRVVPLYALPGAQPAPSVPEGWQLVPTAESRHPGIYKMLGALHAADNTPGMSEWESYRAMLSEAPEVKP